MTTFLYCILLVLSFYDCPQPKKGETSPKIILSGFACVLADGSWRPWGMLDGSVYVVYVV